MKLHVSAYNGHRQVACFTHETSHLHKWFPQRETAIMTAGVWGSPKKKHLS